MTDGTDRSLTWAEVAEASIAEFLAIEARRTALVERERLTGGEGHGCASCTAADGLSVPLRDSTGPAKE